MSNLIGFLFFDDTVDMQGYSTKYGFSTRIVFQLFILQQFDKDLQSHFFHQNLSEKIYLQNVIFYSFRLVSGKEI